MLHAARAHAEHRNATVGLLVLVNAQCAFCAVPVLRARARPKHEALLDTHQRVGVDMQTKLTLSPPSPLRAPLCVPCCLNVVPPRDVVDSALSMLCGDNALCARGGVSGGRGEANRHTPHQ